MKKGMIFLFLLCAASGQAQNMAGRITDARNNPVEQAVVVIQTVDSAFVEAACTDSAGVFSVAASVSPFLLTVQHLLYETYRGRYDSPHVGIIRLRENNRMLREVAVTAERPLVKAAGGKMTYDMPQLLKDRMAVSAYEAILELPGVEERRGKLELAGANGVTVVLNGKATRMGAAQLENLLKNMPKERIREAEVMYSAPPEYQVRGAVINLVLESGSAGVPALQGQANALYSQGRYANYQAGATVVYRTPRSATDLMYSFGYRRERTGEDFVSNHAWQGRVYQVVQSDRGHNRTPVHTFRLGNEWTVSDTRKLSFAYTAEVRQFTHAFTASEGTFSNSRNSKKSDKPVQMHNLALGYTAGSGFSAGAEFTSYTHHATQYYREETSGKEDAFNARSNQDIRRISAYADQSHRLGKEWTLSYGAKFAFASDKSSQAYTSLGARDWSGADSYGKSREYVYDVYAGFSKSFSGALSLSASLTGEYYRYREAGYRSLFPRMELTYTPRPGRVWQLSVASDKAYPAYWEMQNAVSYLSGYNEIQGNPDLKPSRLYLAQLNYILKSRYVFTLYANYVRHNFNQLPYQSPDRLVLIYQTLNFDYSATSGLNVTVPFRIGSLMDSRLTLNGYYERAKSNRYHDIRFDKDNWACYASLDNTFTLSSKPDIKAVLSGAYNSRPIQGPMVISAMYRVDAGVKWTFAAGRAELSFRADDLFNSWSPENLDLRYKTQNFTMHLIPDSRRFSLAFVYKFGDFREKPHRAVDSSRFGK